MTIHILVGTTSGNTEWIADTLKDHLEGLDHQCILHDQPQLQEVPVKDTTWLLCIATHGAGEYGESIAQFMEELTAMQPDLSQLRAAVLAVGDSSYDTFCQAGIDAEQLLINQGAQILSPRYDIDMLTEMDPEASALTWLKSWESQL